MRHRVVTKKLGRDAAHRKALLKNLSEALILNGSAVTTLAKAKYVRPYIERLVTKARVGSDHTTVQRVSSKLWTKKAARKLFEEIAPKFKDIPGGYTRITKLPERLGDNSPMASIEFIEVKKETKEDAK